MSQFCAYPVRTPTSFPTECAIFRAANATLDFAFNTLKSKNGLLCPRVLRAVQAENLQRQAVLLDIGKMRAELARAGGRPPEANGKPNSTQENPGPGWSRPSKENHGVIDCPLNVSHGELTAYNRAEMRNNKYGYCESGYS
jgi:hypothetical protein